MSLLNKAAQMMGKKGGQKSAESRLGNMTAEERSKEMRRIRLSKTHTPEQIEEMEKEMDQMGKEFVENLNRNVSKE